MKLLDLLFPVHIALHLENGEIAALKGRAEAYLGTDTPTPEERVGLSRIVGILDSVQRDHIDSVTGPEVVFSAAIVHDLALLASPALDWCNIPVSNQLFAFLNLLVSQVPAVIDQGEAQSVHRDAFIEHVATTIADDVFVAGLVTRTAEEMTKRTLEEQKRTFRVRIVMGPTDSVEIAE